VADDQRKQRAEALGPVLEAPPAAESPGSALFGDDAAVSTASRLMVAETFLSLLVRDLKFHDFMREVLLATMKVVKSEAGSLLEVDHENRSLFFRAVVGQSSDRVSRFLIPLGQGVVGYVADSRQPLIVDKVEDNKFHLKVVEYAVGFKARNLVALPIIVRGKVFGVLELLNRVGEGGYTADDVELLTYVCTMAAKAIEVRLMLAWSASGEKAA